MGRDSATQAYVSEGMPATGDNRPSATTGTLAARSVGKRYRRGRLALQEIDLDIQPSRITALVGPNGAGKSTLMKAWVGFERPTAGAVSVAGIDPWQGGGRARALQHVGYVPQETALYRELTVDQHLRLAQSLRPRFDPMVARERLADLAIDGGSRVAELSGGQRAQVSLALALAAGGEILILVVLEFGLRLVKADDYQPPDLPLESYRGLVLCVNEHGEVIGEA